MFIELRNQREDIMHKDNITADKMSRAYVLGAADQKAVSDKLIAALQSQLDEMEAENEELQSLLMDARA